MPIHLVATVRLEGQCIESHKIPQGKFVKFHVAVFAFLFRLQDDFLLLLVKKGSIKI